MPFLNEIFKNISNDTNVILLWMLISFHLLLDCPGVQSETAGKAEACAGCPNQNLCASSKSQEPDPGKIP